MLEEAVNAVEETLQRTLGHGQPLRIVCQAARLDNVVTSLFEMIHVVVFFLTTLGGFAFSG